MKNGNNEGTKTAKKRNVVLIYYRAYHGACLPAPVQQHINIGATAANYPVALAVKGVNPTSASLLSWEWYLREDSWQTLFMPYQN